MDDPSFTGSGSRVHILRIGKTGSTALRLALTTYQRAQEKEGTPASQWVLHGHDTTLEKVPVGDKVVVVVRDVVTRFVSAFWFHQRTSASPEERDFFRVFPTPRDLSEALTSSDDATLQKAKQCITHPAFVHFRPQLHWFGGSLDYARSRCNDFLLVGRQETLGEDFYRLITLLSVPASVVLTQGVRATPSRLDGSMSDLARRNVEQYYHDDRQLLRECAAWGLNPVAK